MAQVTGIYRTTAAAVVVSTDLIHGIIAGQTVRVVGSSVRALTGISLSTGTASAITTGTTVVGTITTVTFATPLATYTTSAAHGFAVGQYVTITGMAAAGNNGSFFITAVGTATTFTVSNISGVAATVQTGSGTTLPSLTFNAATTGTIGDQITSASVGSEGMAIYPLVTIRPNSVYSNDGFTAVGTTSLTTAVTDNLNTTYVYKPAIGNPYQLVYNTSDISAPAATQYVYALGIRAGVWSPSPTFSSMQLGYDSPTSGAGYQYDGTIGGSAPASGFANIDWDKQIDSASTATVAGPWDQDSGGTAPWTTSSINATRLWFYDQSLSTVRTRFYDVWADVVLGVSPYLSALPVPSSLATTRPTISWTHVHPDYYGQVAYQVKLFTTPTATPSTSTTGLVWDSGVVYSGSNSVTVGTDLLNATLYYCYVTTGVNPFSSYFGLPTTAVTTKYGAWGSGTASSFNTFTLALVAPTAPTTTAVWQAGSQAFLLTSTGAVYAAGTQTFTVQRSDDGGTTWAAVRNGTGLVPNGSFITTITDYEADRDSTLLRYRTVAVGINSGQTVSTTGTGVTGTPVSDNNWWLKAPLTPTLNQGGVLVQAQNLSITRVEDVGVFRPYGRSTAVTVSGVLGGKDGQVDIVVVGTAAWVLLEPLIVAQQTLLVQDPLGDQRYVRFRQRSYQVEGNRTKPVYRVSLDYVEVSAP